MKHIIIVANFCRPFDGKVDGRFLYLSEMLSDEGYEVELITSDFSHSLKTLKSKPVQSAYKSKLTYCHEPGYIKHASIKRLWSHFIWGINVMRYIRKIEKPDLIYCAIPSLTAPQLLARYCKKSHIKYAIDIQDLWPEATFMLVKNKLLQKATTLMTWYANLSYSKADIIFGVSDTYIKRALSVNNISESSLVTFLGNDRNVFDDAKKKFFVPRNDDDIFLCYIGTLSYSYDIECVIDALEIVKKRGVCKKNIKFVLVGNGPLKSDFEKYAKAKDIDCQFMGHRNYDEMVGILCSCDIAVNPITEGSAASIINKVGDYALSGLPVINTQECNEYRELINSYKCGINCKVGCADDVALAIETLANNSSVRLQMGIASRTLGLQKFDRANTYRQIVTTINILLKN